MKQKAGYYVKFKQTHLKFRSQLSLDQEYLPGEICNGNLVSSARVHYGTLAHFSKAPSRSKTLDRNILSSNEWRKLSNPAASLPFELHNDVWWPCIRSACSTFPSTCRRTSLSAALSTQVVVRTTSNTC